MRRWVLTTAVMLASQAIRAESSLTLPWDEFKSLYSEKIQQQFDLKKTPKVIESLVSINEASYKVSIAGNQALVDVVIRGTHLQGKPQPIALFDHQVAISQINNVEGGAIINNESGYLFFIDQTEQKVFQVSLTLVVSLTEDRQAKKLSFNIPAAVRNVLDVELPLDTDLIEHPGIRQSLQRYYFAPQKELTLRFADARNRDQQIVDIDTFTQVELQADKYIFTLNCVPDRLSKPDLELSFKQPLRYLDSSLAVSKVKLSTNNKLIINAGKNEGKAFFIRFETDAKEELQDLFLPQFTNNIEVKNNLQIIEPVEAEISFKGETTSAEISSSRLPQSIQQNLELNGFFHSLEKGKSFAFDLKRFSAVKAPDVVLESLYFYTSFAENGNEISVLRMDVPKDIGDRLELNPIKGAEIWSLTVNGVKQEVYSQITAEQDLVWVLPLAENADSVIELTYLQRHKKLGLEGKLAINLPETGLAAEKVFVNIGLAERVELVAIEGDLSPAENEQCPTVSSFTGKPYIFKYPFYRGKAMQAAIYYKEPLVEDKS